MNERIKTNCKFLNTPACALLNAKNCKSCPMFPLDAEQMNDACEDMRVLCENLPENGVEPLFYSEECMLCKRAEKGRPAYFAQLNLGHINPLAADGKAVKGKKTHERQTRLVIPVQLPVCASCRRKLLLKYNLPLVTGVLFAGLGLLIASLESVRRPLAAIGRAMPFSLFLMIAALGVFIAGLIKNKLAADIKKQVKECASESESLAEMTGRGWFTLPAGKKEPIFTFTKKRLRSGILTGENQNELIKAVLDGNKRPPRRENKAENKNDNDTVG